MITCNIYYSIEVSYYIVLFYVLYLLAEILETFSSLPVLTMTTEFTAHINFISTTDSQQFSRYTTLHHTSSVSSVKHTTASVINITQLPQCEHSYVQLLHLHNS